MATPFYTWLSARTSKTTPVDADSLPLADSVGGATKKLTWANLKAYLDTLYLGVVPVVSAATPVVAWKDTSCTDADVNFDITASATDTGTGAEDIDVTFSAQVAGNKVGFINFDADGLLSLGYGGQTVYIAKLASICPVTPVTTTATPASTDSGTTFSNEGDGDGATVTLPTALAGLQFTFVVQAAQTLTITANSGDTIRIGSSVTAAAGSITCSTVGSAITLQAINATEWFAVAAVGSWTI